MIDLPIAALFGVAVLMGINYLVMGIAGLKRSRLAFYTMQLVNVTAGSVILVFGMPGFHDDLWIVDWLLGLLFIVRTVLNNNGRAKWLRREAELEEGQLSSKKDALTAALEAGSQASGRSDEAGAGSTEP